MNCYLIKEHMFDIVLDKGGYKMAQNPIKPLKSAIFKSLNTPVPISVKENQSGRPLSVANQRITSILDTWRIDDEWWRQTPISRMYWAVTLASGKGIMIFKDGVEKN
jgi:hypothetical protein